MHLFRTLCIQGGYYSKDGAVRIVAHGGYDWVMNDATKPGCFRATEMRYRQFRRVKSEDMPDVGLNSDAS